jgi:hypothetical protein
LDDAIEGHVACGGERSEDLEDVGGLVDDFIAGLRVSELGCFFEELRPQRRTVGLLIQCGDVRCTARAPDDVGDLVPDEFSHAVIPPSR